MLNELVSGPDLNVNSINMRVPVATESRAALEVYAALHSEIVAAAPLALKTALELLQDTRISAFGTPLVSAKVKQDIAFKILDRAGHVAPRAPEAKARDLPLHEMSVDELRDLARELGAEIAERAKPVDVPNAPQTDNQAVDSLM